MRIFTHRTAVHASDSIVIINGQKSVALPLEQFLEVEPDYALPLGFIQREYSPGLRHDLISIEGEVRSGQMPWELGDKFIEKISDYQNLKQQTPDIDVVEEASTLEAIKERQIQVLSNSCNKTILEGFTSSALKSVYHYDGSLESQTNLIGALALAHQTEEPVTLTCTPIETGNKQPRPHTLQQIEQVFADGCTFKTSKIAKYHELKAQVLAATSKEAVTAITWDDK